MSILITILLGLAGFIALVLIMALFMRKEHFVKRDIVINAPRQKVFDYVRLVKKHEEYNKWAKTDPNRKTETKGTDGTVGFVYAWSGNKSAGEGEKEIVSLIEGERIETEFRFVKPFKAIAHFITTTESLSDEQTKVTWSNRSSLSYPLNIMVPMVEKGLAKDMDESLNKLKEILEQ